MARKHSKNGTEKHLNLPFKQCTREHEAKVDGTEERVPVGANRSTSTAAKAKKERIMLEWDSAPRSEARNEDNGQEKGGKCEEFAGAVVNLGTLRQIASRRVG